MILFNAKIKKVNIVGLQAAFLSKGKLTWGNSYGFQNFKNKEKVNDSTSFLIASCSKPVTTLAVLKLHDSKKLKLDDDINQYLPFSIKNRILLTKSALSLGGVTQPFTFQGFNSFF